MKVAITGASGHVGVALIEELTRRGHHVRALGFNDVDFFIKNNIEYVKGHVNDRASIEQLLTGCDALIHSAAVISINGGQGGHVRKVNVDGVRNVMQTALDLNIQRVVHISSIHAYDPLPKDATLDETRNFVDDTAFAYDQSKRDGQLTVMEFVNKGLPALIVNPTSVTGQPENKLSLQGKAILDIYLGKIPAMFAGGYDWVDVRDVASSICNALTMGRVGENYLLSGKYYTMKEIVAIVSEVKGKKIRVANVPVWLVQMGLPFVKLQSLVTGKAPLYTNESIDILLHGNSKISHEKAKLELNHNPRSFKETVADLIVWFKANGYIK